MRSPLILERTNYKASHVLIRICPCGKVGTDLSLIGVIHLRVYDSHLSSTLSEFGVASCDRGNLRFCFKYLHLFFFFNTWPMLRVFFFSPSLCVFAQVLSLVVPIRFPQIQYI